MPDTLPRSRIAQAATAALFFLAASMPTYSQAQTPGMFTSPAAIAAQTKRDAVVSQAQAQLVTALKAVLPGVMQSGQLDEANRINKIIESGGAVANEPLISLRGKAAQATYRSALQRATSEYATALKGALTQSMKAGQLEESNRISAELRAVDEGAKAMAMTTPGFTNLLPLIDPAKGTIQGEFKLDKGALVSSGKGQERLEVPYEVPEEYDYQTTFTHTGKGPVVVVHILSGNGHPFIWAMNTGGSFTFHYLKGAGIGANKTTVKAAGLKENKRYTLLLKVRKNGVQAVLDGKLLSKWDTDFTDSVPEGFWALRNKKALGVGSADSEVTFHTIEVREITGKGRMLK